MNAKNTDLFPLSKQSNVKYVSRMGNDQNIKEHNIFSYLSLMSKSY